MSGGSTQGIGFGGLGFRTQWCHTGHAPTKAGLVKGSQMEQNMENARGNWESTAVHGA